MKNAGAINQIEQNKFDLAAKQGTYNLNTAGSEVVNRGGALVTDVMADVQRMQTSGQPITEDVKRSLISKANASFGAATAAMLAKTSGLNISGTAINAELSPLNILRDNTIKMIEDGTLLEMMSQNPFQDPPPYEKLVADLAGAYSRRINIQHRLVYQVYKKEKVVKVLRLWTYYE